MYSAPRSGVRGGVLRSSATRGESKRESRQAGESLDLGSIRIPGIDSSFLCCECLRSQCLRAIQPPPAHVQWTAQPQTGFEKRGALARTRQASAPRAAHGCGRAQGSGRAQASSSTCRSGWTAARGRIVGAAEAPASEAGLQQGIRRHEAVRRRGRRGGPDWPAEGGAGRHGGEPSEPGPA